MVLIQYKQHHDLCFIKRSIKLLGVFYLIDVLKIKVDH
ncbi:hypothetical protein J500_0326 [Acinetobacter sp. 479375]|nr:hypothetical protein J500_0326 [Acinetobacter sp. 479375]